MAVDTSKAIKKDYKLPKDKARQMTKDLGKLKYDKPNTATKKNAK